MEDERVFADTHALILEWLSKENFDGVRVDHPDGLRDPKEYFERLHKASPRAWIVAEKILEPGEHLPSSWPIAGTTGRVNNLFVDADGHAPLTDLYREFSGEPTDFTAVVYDKKIGRSAKDRSSE
jgi:(1->4)-alpha-D-glucan 1-alpha-D-glucosylmutase